MSKRNLVFRFPKLTGTHAEVFAVAGLADYLTEFAQGTVSIRDCGGYFEVHPDPWIAGAIHDPPQSVGYPFLKANDKVKVPEGVTDIVDYKAEKVKVDRFRKATGGRPTERVRGKASGARPSAAAGAEKLSEQDRPRPDWRLLQVLNTLQGDQISGKVHAAIVNAEPADFKQQVSVALGNLAQGRPSSLQWPKSAVMLFNPNLAKGYARLRPDSTARGDSTKEQWADPFTDWLKFRGYFRIACPFFLGSKGEHVRMIVPVPGDITARAFNGVASNLRTAGVFGAAPKIDALAVLSLAQILIEGSEEYRDPNLGTSPFPSLSLANKRVNEVISGVIITHYQSMGSAKAVSDMSMLSLPGWFALRDSSDVSDMLTALQEHKQVIRGLRDDHSDEIDLLIKYRRFLEQRGERAARAFLGFLEPYALFWMGTFGLTENGVERRPRRFNERLVRRILVENVKQLSEIADNPGFIAIARAIRKSTVSAQALKAMKKDVPREIRYGLLHELRRKRSLSAEEFVEAVADFVSKYNAENARLREIKGDLRAAPANITDAEFLEFVGLFDKGWKPSLVGALLTALGSCREDRDAEPGLEEVSEDDAEWVPQDDETDVSDASKNDPE